VKKSVTFEDRLEVDKALGELRDIEAEIITATSPLLERMLGEFLGVCRKAHAEILKEVADVGDE